VLPIFIAMAVLLNILLITSSKRVQKPFDKFQEESRLANSARKKDIPPEMCVSVNIDALPFTKYDENDPNYSRLNRTMESVQKKVALPMFKLPAGMSNNDIKHAYGVANFDMVVSREENYSALLRAMIIWAEELIKAEKLSDAEAVLRETINLKSDHSKSYTLLCNIYRKTDDREKLAELKTLADSETFFGSNAAMRDKIRIYLENGSADGTEKNS